MKVILNQNGIRRVGLIHNLEKIAGLILIISTINLSHCKAQTNLERNENILLREQNFPLPLPPPIIIISQKRKKLFCNASDLTPDEFEFGGDSPPCYETISTTFSKELENTVLGTDGDRLIFQCTAPYITRWMVITPLPTKGTSYIESRREGHNPFNTSNATITNEFRLIVSGPVVDSGSSGASGWIKCQNAVTENENQTTGVYLFSQSGDAMVADELIEVNLNLSEPLSIKCLANYPDVRPRLEEEVEKYDYQEVETERILKEYDPRYGFVVQGSDKLEQTYRCVTEETDKLAEHEFLHHFKTIISQENLTLDTGFLATEHSEIEIQDTNEKLSDIACGAEKSYNIIIKMIRCKSIYHCDWLSVCFEKCFFKYDSEALEKRLTSTLVTLSNPFFAGKTTCRVWLGSKTVFKYYFIGLDRLSYFTDNENIPKDALIRLNTDERDFYTYQSTQFLCEISTFLLAPNIQFAVVYKNGTKMLLQQNSSSIIDDHMNNITVSEVLMEYENRGFAQRNLVLNLTKDMTDLLCLAPWYNSTEWIQQSMSFKPKDFMLPSIDKSAGKGTRTLYAGRSDQVLYCSASGDPKPFIKWNFPESFDDKLKHTIKSPDLNEGESTLYFPLVEDIKIFTGTFTCIAENQFGQDTFNFEVYGEDLRLGAGAIAGISIASFGFLTVLAGFIYFGYKYHYTKNKLRDLTEEEIKEFTEGNEDAADAASQSSEATDPEKAKAKAFKKSFVIAEEDLVIAKDSVLGQGEFGMVYRGILHGDAVAVKTTKPNADVSYFKAMLVELKIMGYIGDHPHVVSFKGAVTNRIRERIVYAVLELSPFGSLNSYLRKLGSKFFNLLPNVEGQISTYENVHATVTQVNMIEWCKQIADGMDYLSFKKVCHADLATRNVLVFKNDVVKITDFGLSKQLYNYCNYVKKKVVPLPWRWLALETIRYMEFSSKSDVWSFGVTMWEIFSLSQVPYPGETYAMDFVDKLLSGMRLRKPVYCPQPIYDLMIQTWHEDSELRPTFAKLRADLDEILKDENLFKKDSDRTTTDSNGTILNVYTKVSALAGTPAAESKLMTKTQDMELAPATVVKPKPKVRRLRPKPKRTTYINVGKL